MSTKLNRIRKSLAVTGVAAAAALAIGAGTPAAANEMHGVGMRGGMGVHGGGFEMHGRGGWGHEGYGHGDIFKPHNAASHFILLAHELNFNQNQMQQLMQMRDQWIQNNAVAEAQLRAYKSDLKWLLMSNIASDNFNQQAIDNKLQQIKQVDAQLWKNYVSQLQSINQLMTSQQKNELMGMMAERAHGGRLHENMPGGGMQNRNMNRNPSSSMGNTNNNMNSGGMNQGGSATPNSEFNQNGGNNGMNENNNENNESGG